MAFVIESADKKFECQYPTTKSSQPNHELPGLALLNLT